MGAVAAIIIRREKELVAHFRQAGAVSSATAQSLGALHVDDGTPLQRLRERAVIREGAPGTFYLDEPSWLALSHARRRLMLVMLVVVVVFGVAAALASRGSAAP
ncbi:MAG: hypothetical protein ABI587_02130 [Gemmatimonadales bacterium]